MRNPKCWARSLDNCDRQMSKEHIVSDSQFDGPSVTVSGLPWCREPRTVGLASLASRKLCRKHNSDLSEADDEVVKLRDAAGAMIEPHLIPIAYELDARLIERWLLKTTINVALQGKPPALIVTDELVRIAFGLQVPRPGQGFFFVGEVGEQVAYRRGHIRIDTLLRKGTVEIAVATFAFHGCRLLYALEAPPNIRGAFRMRLWSSDVGDRIQLRWKPNLSSRDHEMLDTIADELVSRSLPRRRDEP